MESPASEAFPFESLISDVQSEVVSRLDSLEATMIALCSKYLLKQYGNKRFPTSELAASAARSGNSQLFLELLDTMTPISFRLATPGFQLDFINWRESLVEIAKRGDVDLIEALDEVYTFAFHFSPLLHVFI